MLTILVGWRDPADKQRAVRGRARITRLITTSFLGVVLSSVAFQPALSLQPGGHTATTTPRVTCADAPGVFDILCRAYQLIIDNYIDPVEDPVLAGAASRAIEQADLPPRTTGPPPACPLPTPEFEEVCARIDLAQDTAAAVEAAIGGMADSLDEHSYYLGAEDRRRLEEAMENRGTTGLGISVGLIESGDACVVPSPTCVPVITEVYPGSPADLAGLQVGDVILELGARYPAELSCAAVAGLDRFEADEQVRVSLARGSETIEATIEAAGLVIPAARGIVFGDDVGYLRLDVFSSSSDREVEGVLEQLISIPVRRLVLDLRGNTGGYLTPALGIAGLFISEDSVAIHEVSRENTKTITAGDGGMAADPDLLPMVAVVDGNSASASEVVVGVLRDHGRVTVAGRTTYGKDTAQSTYRLEQAGHTIGFLTITTLRWLTPTSSTVAGGIEPDVVMELPPCLALSEVADRALSALGPRFIDIGGNVHEQNILRIASLNITRGCNEEKWNLYCPDQPVTRAQAATLLTRILDLTPTSHDHFTDDNGTTHEQNINRLAQTGITTGCNPTNQNLYCPNQPITRAQAATLLTRILDLTPTSHDHFTDDNGTTHEQNINRLAQTGITTGCNPTNQNLYCPNQPITRAQIATLLTRALDLLAN